MGDFVTPHAERVKRVKKSETLCFGLLDRLGAFPEIERGGWGAGGRWGEFGVGGASSCESVVLDLVNVNSTSELTVRTVRRGTAGFKNSKP